MQVVVSRMIRESAVFFSLLFILGLGFAQSLLALDAADGRTDPQSLTYIATSLLQSLFGSPDFESPKTRYGPPFGSIIIYAWTLLTTVLLINILTALFAGSYAAVTDDAVASYMSFFAAKAVGLVRAPDTFVYPAVSIHCPNLAQNTD